MTADHLEIPRDRFGRPLITPPEGGKAVPYNRASSYGDVLDDKTNLTLWKQRMTALGLVDRPDLLLAVAVNRTDKSALNKISEQALEASGGGSKASIGTSLHSLTEAIDRGEDVGFVPAEFQADLDAYREASAPFRKTLIERFMVNDRWKIAGTPDRIVTYDGDNYIWDLKTGSVEYGWPKIAVQLTASADGVLYDPEKGRLETPVLNSEWGIVCHLPSGSGVATLYWVDLAVGRAGIQLSSEVRGWRKATRSGIAHKFTNTNVPI